MIATSIEIGVPEVKFHVQPVAAAPKILLYSHDSFGLGNIRRTLLLADALTAAFPGAAALIVTGSPMIHAMRIPEGLDYIKLPCIDRVDADRYEPRFLQAWSREVKEMRRAILTRAALGFAPDLVIVDKRPAGIDDELLETLHALRQIRPQPAIVLGLRDILDEPVRSREALVRSGAFTTIERYYDEVWVYGSPAIFDLVREYEFPAAVARKTVFCGYLRRPTVPQRTPDGVPHVLVTTGGGGDGGDLIEAYLDGLLGLPRRLALRSTIIFGPQMPAGRRTTLLDRYGTLSDVTFLDFEPELARRYAEADVVVSMAGYNTVCELLSFGCRAVLVPRTQPVKEQLVRARRLAAHGVFAVLEPNVLTGESLIALVLRTLRREAAPAGVLDLGGVGRVVERAHALLAQRGV